MSTLTPPIGSIARTERKGAFDDLLFLPGFAYRSDSGVVFLWCTFPFVALVLSTLDLVRRNSLTVRRAAFAASFGATIYVFAFILWVRQRSA